MQTKHVLTFNFPKTRLQIEYATTFWRKFQASTFTIKSFSNSRRAQDVNPGFLLPRNTGEEKDLAHMSESLAQLAHMSESLAQLAHMSESLAQLAHMSESLAQLAHMSESLAQLAHMSGGFYPSIHSWPRMETRR